ncbi:MAG: ATP-binding cassette domain-containing protein [Gammaproteobacteria bacterium]|nr:ATP-binding cassette domain-containing protein [Gammaproteobacteria bacterium]
MHAIDTRKLRKSYGSQLAVDDVTLQVESGEFCGLLGPNGAGKTTLLRMLTGNTPPTAGQLEVLGFPIPVRAREMRHNLGIVPQEDNLDPDFSVVENLRIYASYFRINSRELEPRLRHLLEFAALTTKAEVGIGELSGGMRRRLSLIRALVNDPALLVLDEPTTGLDPQARQVIWQRLRLLKNQGKTLLLTTHYMEEAQRLCDRVIILDHGHILANGAPLNLIKEHIEPQVLEVHGNGLDRWHHEIGTGLAERHEEVGETMYYYTTDEEPLLSALGHMPNLTFLHRPANLEDVFLKLTGRELRDG